MRLAETTSLQIVVSGTGAAGSAIIRLLHQQSATKIIGCDKNGVVHQAGPHGRHATWLVANTNIDKRTGTFAMFCLGADVFIGISALNLLTGNDVAGMADKAICKFSAGDRPLGGAATCRRATSC